MNKSTKLQFIQLLLIIVSITIAIRASNNMIITTLPLFAKYVLYFPPRLVGALATLFSLFTFISSGFLNSRLRVRIRRVTFIMSSFLYIAIFPLFYISTDITIWMISALAGFIMGFIMPNIITAAGLLKDRKARERLLSIYTLALSLSLIIGPILESFLLDFLSLREIFLAFTPFGLATAILSVFIKFPDEQRESTKISVSNVLKNPGFKIATYNILSYNLVFSFLTTFGGIYAINSFHATYSLTTLLFSAFFVTSFLARLTLSIRPINKIWEGVIISIVLSTLGLTLIFIGKSLLLYVIALLILGIPHGLTYPLSLISISRTFELQFRNSANSLFFSVMMLIGIITPLISGFIVEIIGIKNTFTLLIPFIILMLVLIKRNISLVDKFVQH